mmetsp:Transcript_100896/g.217857  ORF Transcript_100896/g.217857 Transcript_100896/m.217857 type:complete len:374 (-) Transcript_100896:42-1163(-)
MLDWLHQNGLLCLCVLPPTLLTAVGVYVLSLSPRDVLLAVVPFIPGLEWKNRSDASAVVAVFHLQKSFDMARQLADVANTAARKAEKGIDIDKLISQIGHIVRQVSEDSNDELNETVDEVEKETTLPIVEEKGLEVIVNIRHLAVTSAIPIALIWFYVWDQCMIGQEASTDFPLLECMDVRRTTCFYITEEYSFWKWPAFEPLACREMLERTVTSPEPESFFFHSIDEAKFYKCYTWNLRLPNVVRAASDSVLLLAIFSVIILHSNVYIVEETSEEDLGGQARRAGWARCRFAAYQVVLAVLCGVVVWLEEKFAYGNLTSDNIALLGPPGFCVFLIIILQCRKELLEKVQELARAQLEELEDSVEDSVESEGL